MDNIDSNNFPLVSIIVPCFNKRGLILETIKSIYRSTYQNLDLIIVNDGSTDPNTLDALKKISKDYSMRDLRIINTVNQGVARARNLGFSQSFGQYILFIDNDDLIDKNYIKNAVNHLENNGDLSFVYPDVVFFGDVRGLHRSNNFNKRRLLFRNYIPVSCVYKKKDIINFEFNDELEILEDWDYLIKVVKDGNLGSSLHGSYLFYRISLSGRNKINERYVYRKKIIQSIINENNIHYSFTEKLMNMVSIVFSPLHERLKKIISIFALLLAIKIDPYMKEEIKQLKI